MRKSALLFFGFIFLVTACAPLGWPITSAPTGATPVAQNTPAPTVTPGAPASTPVEPNVIKLKIWAPPHMDPAADTPAGKLLQARLDQFSRQHDDLSIVVRVKSVSGPGGLLDSLVATNAAAPLALPDLIALPRDGLEAAALKGLLQSVENPESPLDDTGWYEFSRELIRVQNIVFGFPICGDALVTVFRPAMVSQPPQNWSEVLELKTPFVFPAADQQAIFTLAQYQSLGIPLRDDEGRPHLEIDQLSQVLTFYGNAEERGVMPFWVTQYQDDQEVWDAYLEKRADIIVAWLTDYLNAPPEDSDFSILPVENEQGFTLADGWVWSVASIQTEKREIAIELAKFLSEDRFLAAYADSLGCIAPYKGAVKNQLDPAQRVMIEQIALSARVIPFTDILNSLGLPLQQAVMQVLKNQAEPIPAAQSVIDALTSP